MREGAYHPKPLPEGRVTELPQVFRLVDSNAPVAEISRQMYVDFFSQDHDPEKTYLGIKGLAERGPEGRAALMQMAAGNDDLSSLVAKIYNSLDSDEEIEKFLGIKRFGELSVGRSVDEDLIRSHAYAKEKGYVGDLDYLQCLAIHAASDSLPGTPQDTGRIESLVFNTHLTFGCHEPTYLELLGPLEILKLRTNPRPQMLLLGSMGVYSAREFDRLARKINEGAETSIIEIHPPTVGVLKKDFESRSEIIEGDALDMPLRDESRDHIYTNGLFHYLRVNKDGRTETEKVKRLFEEAHRVLRKGGSFVISELPYGDFRNGRDIHEQILEVEAIAKNCGFKIARTTSRELIYTLRKEVGSATIDSNGFPHYENSYIKLNPYKNMNGRFVKE